MSPLALHVQSSTIRRMEPNFGFILFDWSNCWPCVVARLLLAETLVTLGRVRPEIGFEFREKVCLLQKEKPLAPMPGAIVQRILGPAFGLGN